MLRIVIAALLGLALCAMCLFAWMTGHVIWGPTIMLAILFAALLFENYRYKSVLGDIPERPWQATNERFVDPSSSQEVVVYFNPSTGERKYVAARDSAGTK